jgi:antitoxin (DNA-binding transcriptional repressor) of toxin-antitoxin stability system
MKKKRTITIPATVAQRTLGDIFDEVEKGTSVIFTKYGKAIGKLIPYNEDNYLSREELFNSVVNDLPKQGYLGKPIGSINTAKMIRKMRDEEADSI